MEVGRMLPHCVEPHLSLRAELPSGGGCVEMWGMFASHIDPMRLWGLGGWMEMLTVLQLTGKFFPLSHQLFM